jgi:hypothetical protein
MIRLDGDLGLLGINEILPERVRVPHSDPKGKNASVENVRAVAPD